MNKSNQAGGHANESFRFVQLSDLHLSSIGLPNPLRLMNKRILGYLSWLRRRRHTHQQWVLNQAIDAMRELHIDHYAITGDLTHIGLTHEFKQALQWLEQLASPQQVTVIPGNHDLYVNEHWSRSFTHWEPYLHDPDAGDSLAAHSNDALTRLNQLYPIVRLRKNVAFIGVNSVFDAPWFRATGELHAQGLQRLEKIIRDPALQTYCKILLIHHPLTLTHTPARKSLLNHTALQALLQQHPVDLVLHGHGHHSCEESIQCHDRSQIPVIGVASTSSTSQQENRRAEFLLFEIRQKNQHWAIENQRYTLDSTTRRFIEQGPRRLLNPQHG